MSAIFANADDVLARLDLNSFEGWYYNNTSYPLSRDNIEGRYLKFFVVENTIYCLRSPVLPFQEYKRVEVTFSWKVNNYNLADIHKSDPMVELLDTTGTVVKSAIYSIPDMVSKSHDVDITIDIPEGQKAGVIRISAPNSSIAYYAYILSVTVTGLSSAGLVPIEPMAVRVWSNGDCIFVKNGEGKSINIYDTQGKCVFNNTITGSVEQVTMNTHGVYLVKVGIAPAIAVRL